MARNTCAQPTSLETGISGGWARRRFMTKQYHYDLCKVNSECNWSLSNISKAESPSSLRPWEGATASTWAPESVLTLCTTSGVQAEQTVLQRTRLKTQLLACESHFCSLTLRDPPEIKMLNAEETVVTTNMKWLTFLLPVCLASAAWNNE